MKVSPGGRVDVAAERIAQAGRPNVIDPVGVARRVAVPVVAAGRVGVGGVVERIVGRRRAVFVHTQDFSERRVVVLHDAVVQMVAHLDGNRFIRQEVDRAAHVPDRTLVRGEGRKLRQLQENRLRCRE